MRAEAFSLLRSNHQVFYDEHFTMMSSMPLESSFYDCGRWKVSNLHHVGKEHTL